MSRITDEELRQIWNNEAPLLPALRSIESEARHRAVLEILEVVTSECGDCVDVIGIMDAIKAKEP